jgi:hypothetical protein
LIYSRLATKEDFQGIEIQYDRSGYMSDNIKTLIEQDEFKKAVSLFGQQCGRGISFSLPYCEKYLKYVLAKRDFDNGKMVFVSY